MTVLHYLSVLVAHPVAQRIALWVGNALYPGLGADTNGWRYRAALACWRVASPAHVIGHEMAHLAYALGEERLCNIVADLLTEPRQGGH